MKNRIVDKKTKEKQDVNVQNFFENIKLPRILRLSKCRRLQNFTFSGITVSLMSGNSFSLDSQ